jgi:hypothetical protein
MKKNILLTFFLIAFFSCSKIPLIESSKEESQRLAEIKKVTISSYFEINYSLENFNSSNLNETRCVVNYEVLNISKKPLRASLSIIFQTKGEQRLEGYILGGLLDPGSSTKDKFSFEKIPCNYLRKISFLY